MFDTGLFSQNHSIMDIQRCLYKMEGYGILSIFAPGIVAVIFNKPAVAVRPEMGATERSVDGGECDDQTARIFKSLGAWNSCPVSAFMPNNNPG